MIYRCTNTPFYIILFPDPSQVLMNVLSSRKNMSDSLAYGRLHPQLQPNILLVDGEFFLLVHLLQCFGEILDLISNMQQGMPPT